MVQWFCRYYHVSHEGFSLHLHLHSGQKERNMKKFWAQLTGIPQSNFQKSFVKPEGSGYRKNKLYNGTIKIRVKGKGSTYLLFQVLGAIAGFLNEVLSESITREQWMSRSLYTR